MTAELFRSIVVALGIVWTIFFILMFFMVFYLYQKMSTLHTAIKEVITETKEAIKPVMQVAAIFDAMRHGVDIINKILEVRKGGKENEERRMG